MTDLRLVGLYLSTHNCDETGTSGAGVIGAIALETTSGSFLGLAILAFFGLSLVSFFSTFICLVLGFSGITFLALEEPLALEAPFVFGVGLEMTFFGLWDGTSSFLIFVGADSTFSFFAFFIGDGFTFSFATKSSSSMFFNMASKSGSS